MRGQKVVWNAKTGDKIALNRNNKERVECLVLDTYPNFIVVDLRGEYRFITYEDIIIRDGKFV